jgi:hypothetical protein
MVSRMRAFTIAAVWIAGGLALGLVLVGAAAEGQAGSLLAGDTLLWATLLLAIGLTAAALWIGFGNQSPRTAAGLGGQAALIGLATAVAALLVVLAFGQATTRPAAAGGLQRPASASSIWSWDRAPSATRTRTSRLSGLSAGIVRMSV